MGSHQQTEFPDYQREFQNDDSSLQQTGTPAQLYHAYSYHCVIRYAECETNPILQIRLMKRIFLYVAAFSLLTLSSCGNQRTTDNSDQKELSLTDEECHILLLIDTFVTLHKKMITPSLLLKYSSLTPHEMDHILDSLLKKMTLEEKLGQMIIYPTKGNVTGPTGSIDNIEELIKEGKCGNLFKSF